MQTVHLTSMGDSRSAELTSTTIIMPLTFSHPKPKPKTFIHNGDCRLIIYTNPKFCHFQLLLTTWSAQQVPYLLPLALR